MRTRTLPACAAILAAGGIGARMAEGRPKQLLSLAGESILARSCRALLGVAALAEIVVVVPEAHLAACQEACDVFDDKEKTRLLFTPGGATRQESVYQGLLRLSPQPRIILVHDAARPLASAELITQCLLAAGQHGAAIAALPLNDTVKEVDAGSRLITATLDRNRLWRAQTPQAARKELLLEAYRLAQEDGFQATDEAALLAHAGISVSVIEGMTQNLKITRPEDLSLAQAFLRASSPERGKNMAIKIGHGFDAHRLVPGRALILGGVRIPHTLGLEGHSDADVLCHALMDAILGALSLGDIGRHFPESDARYKGTNSLGLLARVWAMAEARGVRLGNADITVICQQPRLAPHIEHMRARLAQVCGAAPGHINIKATTTEHMGYTGRGEGIAAHAVVLLEAQ